jgi:hypothetical protein
MDYKQSIRSWVEDSALKILVTPFICAGIVCDGEPVDHKSPAPYRSFSQWLDCETERIIRMRGDLSSEDDEDNFCPYDAVERVFPVLYSLKDNTGMIQPFADELIKIISKFTPRHAA